MYYPYGPQVMRQPYYGYPPQVQYRPPYVPQRFAPPIQYPQGIAAGFTSRVFPGYPSVPIQPNPLHSQVINSPQRNFASPTRQLVSPQKPNLLMQSQQQPAPKVPVSPQRVPVSPPRIPNSPQLPAQQPVGQQKQLLTYEEVMARIQNAKNAPQPSVPRAQNPVQQNQPQHRQQHQQAPQQQHHQQQCINQNLKKERPTQDDLEARYQQAIKRTQQIVTDHGLKSDKRPSEKVANYSDHRIEEPDLEEVPLEEGHEELALQYEDGYIYRGSGIPPQTRDGFGILTDGDQKEVYAGYWRDNFYDGQGRLNNLQQEPLTEPLDWNNMTSIANSWANYEGNFVAGKMHGTGTLQLTNGEKYIGEFEEGMVHGDGEFTTLDGQIVKGHWEQGYLSEIQVNE